MRTHWTRLWAILAVAGAVQTGWAENWTGAGGDDNWATSGNWDAGDVPENPDTDNVTFSDVDSGNTGIVTSDWQIGGITSRQTTLDSSGATQTIDLNSKTLTVTGNVDVAVRQGNNSGIKSSELKFTGGTLQLGTPSVPVDVRIGSIDTAQGYMGKVSFVSNVTLNPYIDELKIGFSGGNQSGNGVLDLRNAAIPGGVLTVNSLVVGEGARNLCALVTDNSLNILNTLTVKNDMTFGAAWGKARLGYATGGADDEHKLPAGFTINIGSASAPATSVKIGCTQQNGDGRIYATSGGSFTVYAASMSLADVLLNSQVRTSYGIVDVSTMDSCTIDVGTLIVAKDYGYPGTVNMKAIGQLKLPAGTLEADNVEVGAHKTGSEGLIELNGTSAKINSSLLIEPTGIVRVNVQPGSQGTNGLDLTSATLTINGTGKIELNFIETPGSLVAYNGLAMDGDHVSELESLVASGGLVINDSALGGNYEAVIYTNAGRTYVGVQWPSNLWQEAGIGYFPSYGKALLKMRETLITTPEGQAGLRATIYDQRDFTGNVLMTTLFPDTIDVDWIDDEDDGWDGPEELASATEFSMVFEGTMGPIPESGAWVFYFTGQQATKMYLDDELIYDSTVNPNHMEVELEGGRTYRARITHAHPTVKLAKLSFCYWFKNQRSNMASSDLTIRDEAQQVVYSDTFAWRPPASGFFELPVGTLADGTYEATIASDDYENDVVKPIIRKTFEWEGTTHGVTSTIYAPFEALTYTPGTGLVTAVMREYTQTGLGLWSSVKACINDDMTTTGYKELLAGPIVLKVNGTTLTGSGTFDTDASDASNGQSVFYDGMSSGGPITVTTRCETTLEGAMKVTMTLGTGSVNDMYLEIPLQDNMAPLYHVTRGSSGLRINPAGYTPTGSGVVWDSKAYGNHDDWPGNFKSYIWLGAEERGLAWFGESEKGWELDWGTSSNWPAWAQNGFQLFTPQEQTTIASLGSAADPCQTIFRDTTNGILYLRIHFIQKPVTITTPRTIEFGLMASPGKPMPDNWRALGRSDSPLITFMMGQAAFGLDGAYNAKYPRGKDWSTFTNFYSIRQNGSISQAARNTWIANWATTHIDPFSAMETALADRFKDGLNTGMTKAGQLSTNGPGGRLLSVYFDEFRGTSPWHDEMKTFNTEWHKDALLRGWDQLDWADMPDGPLTNNHLYWQVGTGAFSPSGQDFATWCGKQWLENSVGLYFDNTFMEAGRNPITTNAFTRADGGLQPATRIWARRDYLRRIWILHKQLYNPDWPQAMMCHMTNTHVIPYHTWNQYNLDLEWKRKTNQQLQEKFTPDRLRAETLGLQSGTIPLALTGNGVSSTIKALNGRSHTGGLFVHEIRGPGFGGELMFPEMETFGYGLSDCEVYNYWGDEGALVTIDDALVLPSGIIVTQEEDEENKSFESCQWLLLKRNGKLFMLLTSWAAEDQNITIDVDYAALGVTQPTEWVDAETVNDPTPITFTVDGNGNIVVDMPGYNNDPLRGVRMIMIE